MSTRIDDLERNIGELMNQAGVDEPEKWRGRKRAIQQCRCYTIVYCFYKIFSNHDTRFYCICRHIICYFCFAYFWKIWNQNCILSISVYNCVPSTGNWLVSIYGAGQSDVFDHHATKIIVIIVDSLWSFVVNIFWLNCSSFCKFCKLNVCVGIQNCQHYFLCKQPFFSLSFILWSYLMLFFGGGGRTSVLKANLCCASHYLSVWTI